MFKRFMKNLFLFFIPKVVGNILYFLVTFMLLIISTILVGLSLMEITYSNVDLFVYYLLGSGVTLTLMVLIIILVEKVEFKWKVKDLDASIGKLHRSKDKIGGEKEEVKTSLAKAVVIGIVLIICVVIILFVFAYLFAVIFVDGDIYKTFEYFFQ